MAPQEIYVVWEDAWRVEARKLTLVDIPATGPGTALPDLISSLDSKIIYYPIFTNKEVEA